MVSSTIGDKILKVYLASEVILDAYLTKGSIFVTAWIDKYSTYNLWSPYHESERYLRTLKIRDFLGSCSLNVLV